MRIEHIFNTMYTSSGTLRNTPPVRRSTPPAATDAQVEQTTPHPDGRVEHIAEDTDFLALMVLAMAKELEEQGLLDADKLLARMRQLDGLDGRLDRRLDVDRVREEVDPSRDLQA